MSSIERRIKGWGGSIEWTWKTRSVTLSSVLSARSDAITSSGVPTWTSNAAMSSGSVRPASDKSDVDEMIDDPAQADIREAQLFIPIVRDEKGSRRHDARLAPCAEAPRDRRR